MRNFMAAFLILITSVGGLYIFMATFGGVMDGMYFIFVNLTPKMALATNWNNTANQTLTYWQFFYKSVVIITIALGLWVVRVAFIDQDYTRQG
jgi:hypothetical protein